MDMPVVNEVVFDVTCEELGGYAADCDTENLSVMADTWDELRDNVKSTVERHFQEGVKPSAIRLHLVRDDIIPLT
jgi:hypothetical protein